MNVNSIGLLKQSLIKLSFKLSLDHVTYAHSDDEYSLFLYTSHSHPLLNTIISKIEMKKPIKKYLCVRRSPLPALLHVWLFVTCKDSDQIISQTPLGMSRIPFSSDLMKASNRLEFKDIEGTIQATGSIQCLNGLQGPFQPSRFDCKLSQHYIEQVWTAYDKSQYNPDQRFSYIDTHMGRIPLISFPLLATMIQAPVDQTAQFFQRLLEVAKNFTSNDNDHHELIGEMLTLLSRCLIYQPDTVRTEDGTRSVDQWSSLGCFPSLSLAGFDCEDGAKQILELFHLFTYTQLPKEYNELKNLQKLIQKYRAFMCLGQLNLKEGPTAHCYVVLLDRKYVQKSKSKLKSKEEYEPALVLEATNYTESVWRNQETPNSVIRIFKALDAKITNDREERIYKYKMPQRIVEDEKMYGPITALLSADSTTAEHFLLHDDDEKQLPMTVLGVASNDLFYYKDTVKLDSVLKLEEQEIDLLKTAILSEFPVTGINVTPNNSLLTNFDRDRFLARPIDTHVTDSIALANDLTGLAIAFATV